MFLHDSFSFINPCSEDGSHGLSSAATLGHSIRHVKNKKIRNVAAMPSHSGQKSKNL